MTTVNKIKEVWRGKLFIEEAISPFKPVRFYTKQKYRMELEEWLWQNIPAWWYGGCRVAVVSQYKFLWWKYIKRKPFYERVN